MDQPGKAVYLLFSFTVVFFLTVLGTLLSSLKLPSINTPSIVTVTPISINIPTSSSTPTPTIFLDVKGEQATATAVVYPVVKVVDGDTITVLMNGRNTTLRLIGIDTPETVDPRRPVECYGREASDAAKRMLSGASVRLEADNSQNERDKYSRLLRYVYLEDGTNFNKYMISEGYAYEYTYDATYKYQSEFRAAQKLAQKQQKGLWSSTACGVRPTSS